MPRLISADSSILDPDSDSSYSTIISDITSAGIEGLVYYTLVGTNNFIQTINWWQRQGCIRYDIDKEVNFYTPYDGYTLSLQNLYIEYEMSQEDDFNLICLMSEEACNCAICLGIYYDTEEEKLMPTGRYFDYNNFLQFYQGNIEEPRSETIPLWDDGLENKYWAKNINSEWLDDDPLVGTVGESYEIWRF